MEFFEETSGLLSLLVASTLVESANLEVSGEVSSTTKAFQHGRPGPRASAKEAPSPALPVSEVNPKFPRCLIQPGLTSTGRWHSVCGLDAGQDGPSDRCRVESAVRRYRRVGPPPALAYRSATTPLATRAELHIDLDVFD